MFAKSVAIFTLFALSTRFAAAATPPACLLAALNQQSNPSDVETICSSNAAEVQTAIGDVCGSNTQVALDAFAATCQSAGVTISPVSSTTVSSSSSSSTMLISGSSIIDTSFIVVPLSTSATIPTGALTTTTAVITSAFYNSACSCTTTATFTSTGVSGPSAIVTIPSNSTIAAGTATATRPGYTGAASRMELGAYAGFVVAAGLAIAL